jgi:hypothetical protein
MQNAKNPDLLRFLAMSMDDDKDTQEGQGTLDDYHITI